MAARAFGYHNVMSALLMSALFFSLTLAPARAQAIVSNSGSSSGTPPYMGCYCDQTPGDLQSTTNGVSSYQPPVRNMAYGATTDFASVATCAQFCKGGTTYSETYTSKRCANYKIGGQWQRAWSRPGSLQACADECVRLAGSNCNYFSYAESGTDAGSCLYSASGCQLENAPTDAQWNVLWRVYTPMTTLTTRQYLGCYIDDGSHDFAVQAPYGGYTPASCQNYCSNYVYFAMQDGDTCFCDNDYATPTTTYTSVANSECNKGGTGHGGTWRNAVYTTSSASARPDGYQGCFNANDQNRQDASWVSVGSATTIAAARTLCDGYIYTTTQCPTSTGFTVYCSNQVASSTRIDDAECIGNPLATTSGLSAPSPSPPVSCFGGGRYCGIPFQDCDGNCADMRLSNICAFMGMTKAAGASETQPKDYHRENPNCMIFRPLDTCNPGADGGWFERNGQGGGSTQPTRVTQNGVSLCLHSNWDCGDTEPTWNRNTIRCEGIGQQLTGFNKKCTQDGPSGCGGDSAGGGVTTTTTCTGAKVDMCISIDGSGSVEYSQPGGNYYGCAAQNGAYSSQIGGQCPNYGQEVKFISEIMEAFDAEMAAGDVKISANVFSSSLKTFFSLGQYSDAASMRSGVTNFNYPTGGTATSTAVQNCRNVLAGTGSRSDAQKVMIVMTDGQPNNGYDPASVSEAAKNDGVLVIYVGVGTGLSTAVRNAMATWASPNSYYGMTNFDVSSIVQPLKTQTCNSATTGSLNGQCKGPFEEAAGKPLGGYNRAAVYSTSTPLPGLAYKYMGIQSNNWGIGAGATNHWCTCSNDWSAVTAVAMRRRRDRAESSVCDTSAGSHPSKCNVPCKNSPGETCGGVYYNQVYDLTPKDCILSSWSAYTSCNPTCTSASSLSAATSTWSFCANDGSTCNFQGLAEVRYGYGNTWVTITTTDGTNCAQGTLGGLNTAAWRGANKQCEYRLKEATPTGSRTRTRTIQQAPANGGAVCGATSQSASCGGTLCSVDCEVTDWSSWGSCSATCGGGTQNRQRSVITAALSGGTACPTGTGLNEERPCNTQSCAVDCALSEWTSFGTCTTDGQASSNELPVYTGPLPPGTTPPPPVCEDAKIDMCITIDGSGSVEYQTPGNYYGCLDANINTFDQVQATCPNYGQEVNFIYQIMAGFDTVLSSDGVQIASKQFSNSFVNFADLNSYTSAAAFKSGVSSFRYLTGSTYTKDAIQDCYTALTTGPGARSGNDVSKVIMVVTDGSPSSGQDPSSIAQTVKDNGVNLYFVGVGTGLSDAARSNMQNWASPNMYYGLSNFDVQSLVDPLKAQTCQTAQATRYCHAQPTIDDSTTTTATCYSGTGAGYLSFSSGTCESNGCMNSYEANGRTVGTANEGKYLCAAWAQSLQAISAPALSGAVTTSGKPSPNGCYMEGNTPYYNDGTQTSVTANANQQAICYCTRCSRRQLARPIQQRRTVATTITSAGLKLRSRSITTQPNSVGKQCDATTESTACGTLTCNVDCSLSQWSSWGSCSQSCGTGERFRTRQVEQWSSGSGTQCGGLVEVTSCNTQSCAIDCVLGAWNEWSSCDKDCGTGSMTRTRSVTTQAQFGGQQCGDVTEAGTCQASVTAVGWQSFPNYCVSATGADQAQTGPISAGEASVDACKTACIADSSCSAIEWYEGGAPFGGKCFHMLGSTPSTQGSSGGRWYDATCYVKPTNVATGDIAYCADTQACNSQACPTECVMADWAPWGKCTRTCGTGSQTRSRSVTTQAAGGGESCEAKYSDPELTTYNGQVNSNCVSSDEWTGSGTFGFASSAKVGYQVVTSGTCESNGYTSATTQAECTSWAGALGYGFSASPAYGGQTPVGSGTNGINVISLDAASSAGAAPLGCSVLNSEGGTTEMTANNPWFHSRPSYSSFTTTSNQVMDKNSNTEQYYIGDQTGLTEDECKNWCDGDSSCAVASFKTGYCWKFNQTVPSALISSQKGNTFVKDAGQYRSVGTYAIATGSATLLSATTVTSRAACEDACTNTPASACKGFVYTSSADECKTYSDPAGTLRDVAVYDTSAQLYVVPIEFAATCSWGRSCVCKGAPPSESRMYIKSSCPIANFSYCGETISCAAQTSAGQLDPVTGQTLDSTTYCDLPVCSRQATFASGAMTSQTEDRACNTLFCDVDCEMSPWTAWDTCTAACRYDKTLPTQDRDRFVSTWPVANGKQCPTEMSQRQTCNIDDCPDITPPEIWLPSLKPAIGSTVNGWYMTRVQLEFVSTTTANTPAFRNAVEKIQTYGGTIQIRDFNTDTVQVSIDARTNVQIEDTEERLVTATFPAGSLLPGTKYYIYFDAGVFRDQASTPNAHLGVTSKAWYFTTAASNAPDFLKCTPFDTKIDVPPTRTQFSITYNDTVGLVTQGSGSDKRLKIKQVGTWEHNPAGGRTRKLFNLCTQPSASLVNYSSAAATTRRLLSTGTMNMASTFTLEGVQRHMAGEEPTTIHAHVNHPEHARRLLQAATQSSGCITKMDLVLVMDGSGSVGSGNYNSMKNWAAGLIRTLPVDPDQVRVAFIQYAASSQTRWEYNFDTYTTAEQAAAAAEQVSYISGWATYTSDAINIAYAGLTDVNKGARAAGTGVAKVMMVVTDGRASDSSGLTTAVSAPHADGYGVYAVGVGYGYNSAQLRTIIGGQTPESDFLYQLTGFSDMSTISNQLIASACQQPASVSLDTNVAGSCNQGQTTYLSYSAAVASAAGSVTTLHFQTATSAGSTATYFSWTEKNPSSTNHDVKNEADTASKINSFNFTDTQGTLYVAVVCVMDGTVYDIEARNTTSTFVVPVPAPALVVAPPPPPPNVVAPAPPPCENSITVLDCEASSAACRNMVSMSTNSAYSHGALRNVSSNTLTVSTAAGWSLNGQGLYQIEVTDGYVETSDSRAAEGALCAFETTDDTPPTLIRGTPPHTSLDVSTSTAELTLTFSEPVTLYSGSISVVSLTPTATGGAVTGSVLFQIDVSGSDATVDPSDPYTVIVSIPAGSTIFGDTNYTVLVDAGAVRDRGLTPNPFVGLTSTQYWFVTAHTNAPIITANTPLHQETEVMPDFINQKSNSHAISLTFNVGVQRGSAGNLTVAKAEDCSGLVCTTNFVYNQDIGTANTTSQIIEIVQMSSGTSFVTFQMPNGTLESQTKYVAAVPASTFTDFGGVTGSTPLGTPAHAWYFTTKDVIPPTIVSYVPVPGTTGYGRYSPRFQFTFSENVTVNANQVATTAIVGADPAKSVVMKKKSTGATILSWPTSTNSTKVPGYATLSAVNKRTMWLTLPTTVLDPALDASTDYYFEMDQGIVQDDTGNEFAGSVGASADQVACPAKVDICIAIDDSCGVEGSTADACRAAAGTYSALQGACTNYDNEVGFVVDMANAFGGAVRSSGVQMSAARFGGTASKLFALDDFATSAEIAANDNYNYVASPCNTLTKSGLQTCIDALTDGVGFGARDPTEGVSKMIILVSSQLPSGETSAEVESLADQAYQQGILVHTVGVGLDASAQATMATWAPSASMTHNVASFGALSGLASTLASEVCNSVNASDPTEYFFSTSSVNAPLPPNETCGSNCGDYFGPEPGSTLGKAYVGQYDECGCASPVQIYPDLTEVYVKYDRDLVLALSGTFTITDEDNNKVALQYNLASAADLAFVSLRPSVGACVSCTATSTGSVIYFQVPKALLKNKREYSITLSDGFAYNPSSTADYAPGATWNFNTPDINPPKLKSRYPANEQTGVAVANPSFTMTFMANVLVANSAYIANADGSVAATLSGVASGNGTVTFTSPFGTMLTPLTEYSVVVPNGAITDWDNNVYSGISMCTGCDWTFTTATSAAPTIVNMPGALCNNTINPGVPAVTPSINEQGVLVDTSYVSFRWCVDQVVESYVRPYSYTSSNGNDTIVYSSSGVYENITYGPGPSAMSSGILSVIEKETGNTITGVDLSMSTTGIMSSKTVLGSNDEFRIDFTSNALAYSTEYTVVIPAGTFQSSTLESNIHYEWDFTTAPKPPPLELQMTFPVHNSEHNRTLLNTMQIGFNDTVRLGSSGNICMYRDEGTSSGLEQVLCVDMANPTQLKYFATSSSRRAWDAAPLRRGVSELAGTHTCTGSCVASSGSTVTVQTPSSLNLVHDGQRYAGSLDRGACVGTLGQAAPALHQTDWAWKTNSAIPPALVSFACVTNCPAAATGGGAGATAGGSSGSDIPSWLFILLGILGAIALCAICVALGMYMKKKDDDKKGYKKHLFDDDFDDNDSDFEDDEDFDMEEAVKHGSSAVGAGPGTSARAYRDGLPITPNAVTSHAEVDLLVTKLDGLDHVFGIEDPDLVNMEMRKIMYASNDNTGDIVSSKEDHALGDEDVVGITKNDIAAIAAGIEACNQINLYKMDHVKWHEDNNMPERKKPPELKWKGEMMTALDAVSRMALIGEELPCTKKLLKVSKNQMRHQEDDFGMPVPAQFAPKDMDLLIAQAWPEITRLRLERSAKSEHLKVFDAMQERLADTIEDEEAIRMVVDGHDKADRLFMEGEVLEASHKIALLAPLIVESLQPATMMHPNPARTPGMDSASNLEAKDSPDDGVSLEMKDAPSPGKSQLKGMMLPEELIAMTAGIVQDYHDLVTLKAVPKIVGSAKELEDCLKKARAIRKHGEEGSLAAAELNDAEKAKLIALSEEYSPTMIKLHATSPTIAGEQLEKLLVALERVAMGESSYFYLDAILDEIEPQIARLKLKEHEVVTIGGVLAKMKPITESNKSPEKKQEELAKLLEAAHLDIKMALLGHEKRYKAWAGTAADFNAFKAPKSMSAELMSLASVVGTCEAVVSRGNEDMVASANSEVRKQFRPTKIKPGQPEKFARMLVTMERFIHSTVPDNDKLEDPPVTLAELEDAVQLNMEALTAYDGDFRVDVSKLMTAADVARKIITQSRLNEEDHFAENQQIQDQLIAAVYDAWGNIAKLQTEAQANGMTMSLVQHVGALKNGDVGFDEFASTTSNMRDNLNKLMEEDKDNHNEINLLDAISKLTNVNDPDAINVAARQTKTQLTNLQITEKVTEALKDLFDAFHLYLDDKDSAIPLLRQHVQNYSNFVVKLGAVEDDPFVLRAGLVMAYRCSLVDSVQQIHGHECRHEIPTDDEIKELLENVIGPWVHAHNSVPKSTELRELIEMVEKIVEQQLNARTVKDLTASAQSIKGSRSKVVEQMSSHRRKLAYRQRMQVKKDATETIELRAAEKTGAEWDGFQVESVNLKKVVKETKSKLEQAFTAFDLDNSGTITIEEGMEFLKTCAPADRPKGLKDLNLFMRKQVKARLSKVDADGDGNITFDEFKKWWIENDNEVN